MSEHHCKVTWSRSDREFTYETISRDHAWSFPGGVGVAASSAPDFFGNPDRVDPEEALVAALSSCHMLTFLAIAARKRLVIESYDDDAVGTLEKNADGKMAVTRVVLRPRIVWDDEVALDSAAIERMHHQAHDHCFIANSVKTEIVVEPAG